MRAALARAVPVIGEHARLVLRHGGGGVRDTDVAIALDGRGRPAVTVKTAREERARALLRDEHEQLARLATTLLRVRPGGAPRPLAFLEIDGRAFLIESFLPGRRLKDLDPHETERAHGAVDQVVSWLIDLAHTSGIQRGDLATLVAAPVARYLEVFDTSAAERALLVGLEPEIRAALGSAPPAVVQHGDFADANVLVDGASVGVVDWDEPEGRALPGGDLFHFLASIGATRAGLHDPEKMRRGFLEAFFAPTLAAARNRRRVERYRTALHLPRRVIRPLFALTWVHRALHKLDYLEESGRDHAAATNYPVTVFSGKRCLNVAWTAEFGDRFEL